MGAVRLDTDEAEKGSEVGSLGRAVATLPPGTPGGRGRNVFSVLLTTWRTNLPQGSRVVLVSSIAQLDALKQLLCDVLLD
jgi:hypothetical protein